MVTASVPHKTIVVLGKCCFLPRNLLSLLQEPLPRQSSDLLQHPCPQDAGDHQLCPQERQDPPPELLSAEL